MLPSWISYDSNTVQNWITHHPKPKSPHRVHLLWRITGRISLQQIFFNLGSWSWSSLQNLFEAPGNYIKNSKKQRKCWSCHKMSEVSKKAKEILEIYSKVSAADNSKIQCFWSGAFLPMELPNVTALSTTGPAKTLSLEVSKKVSMNDTQKNWGPWNTRVDLIFWCSAFQYAMMMSYHVSIIDSWYSIVD